MTQLIAFDVYGTLINTQGVLDALDTLIGEEALSFSNLWREKQLEYAYRRGLMRSYRPFSECTRQALDYCCSYFASPLSANDKQDLMQLYARLPAFDDAHSALKSLKAPGRKLVAFSNGTRKDVATLLKNSQLNTLLEDVVSVDELSTFKPNPDVYQYLRKRHSAKTKHTWLISSNPFDIIGARASDLHAVWIKRSPNAVFDPWEHQPSATVSDLNQLEGQIPQPPR